MRKEGISEMKKLIRNKYGFLLIAAVLTLIPALILCFSPEKEAVVFSGEDISAALYESEEGLQYTSGYLELSPGIYRIDASMLHTAEGTFSVEMLSEGSAFRALRGNGAILYPARYTDSVTFYVVAHIHTAQLQCAFQGMTPEALYTVSIVKTPAGYRVFTICLAAFYLALGLIFRFRDNLLRGKYSPSQQVIFWSLCGLVLITCYPYFHDYFTMGADTAYHLMRIRGLADAIASGQQFPVRLHGYLMFEHGYADGLFYPDFFLLPPALLHVAGFSLMTSYRIFVYAFAVFTVAVTYFCFRKCVDRPYIALFGTAVYVLAPYRIYNVYDRGAVGEYLAMSVFPLVLCGMYRLYADDVDSPGYRRNKWFLIAGLTGLIQSHLLSCEMAAVFILLTCLIFIKRTFRRKTFLQLAQAAVISLLINCWFWLPVLYMMATDKFHYAELTNKLMQWQGTTVGKAFQLVPHKGSTHMHIYLTDPIQIGVTIVLTAIAFAAFCVRRFRQRRSRNPYGLTCWTLLLLALLALFMSTCYFPWDAIAKIPGIGALSTSLQFPTRMLSPATALGSFFALFFLPWLQEEASPAFTRRCIAVVTFITVGAAVYQVNIIGHLATPIWLYTEENMGHTRAGNGEYLLAEGPVFEEYEFHLPIAGEGLLWSDYKKDFLDVTVSVENPTNSPLSLQVPLTAYHGYVVRDDTDSGEKPYISETPGPHGDIMTVVPPGYSGRLHIYYNSLPIFRAAEWTSWISIAAIAVFFLRKQGLRRVKGDKLL